MQYYSQSDNQRRQVRHFLKDDIFINIKKDFIDEKFRVRDLSKDGLSFYATDKEKRLVGKKVQVDLISDNNNLILRSLPSEIVFSCNTTHQVADNDENSARYDLVFVRLSNLQKRILAKVINKYDS